MAREIGNMQGQGNDMGQEEMKRDDQKDVIPPAEFHGQTEQMEILADSEQEYRP